MKRTQIWIIIAVFILCLLWMAYDVFGAETNSRGVTYINSAPVQLNTGTSFTIQTGVTVQFGTNRLLGVANPINPTDAANKFYVDTVIAGGGVAWGGITGTLSDQADLQAALDAKQDLLTIGNLTDAGTDGLTITGGTGSIIGSGTSLSQHVADASHNGYLSSTDWTTFNGKQGSLTLGDLTDAGTDGITVTGGTGSVVGSGTSLSQHVADASHNGYLSSTDWTTFNGHSTVTPAALTKTDDTNVTLTLGGTPSTALLQATSLTLGWSGTLGKSRGGLGSDATSVAAHKFFGNNTGTTGAAGGNSRGEGELMINYIWTS
jgi:hypothetical protein